MNFLAILACQIMGHRHLLLVEISTLDIYQKRSSSLQR